MADWFTAQDALDHVGVAVGSPDEDRVESARLAVVALVERRRQDLRTDPSDPSTFTPTDDVVQGARLLLARLYARRQSPAGIAGYGEFGGGHVLRFDPDVEKLLGLGRYAAPMVG